MPSILSIYIYDTDLCDQHLNDQWNDEVNQSVSRYMCKVFSVYISDTDLCDQHLNDQWNEEVNQSVGTCAKYSQYIYMTQIYVINT